MDRTKQTTCPKCQGKKAKQNKYCIPCVNEILYGSSKNEQKQNIQNASEYAFKKMGL